MLSTLFGSSAQHTTANNPNVTVAHIIII